VEGTGGADLLPPTTQGGRRAERSRLDHRDHSGQRVRLRAVALVGQGDHLALRRGDLSRVDAPRMDVAGALVIAARRHQRGELGMRARQQSQ
jgi:hypothetical protein